MKRYLSVKLALEQEQEANRLASELLELNPDNTDAGVKSLFLRFFNRIYWFPPD